MGCAAIEVIEPTSCNGYHPKARRGNRCHLRYTLRLHAIGLRIEGPMLAGTCRIGNHRPMVTVAVPGLYGRPQTVSEGRVFEQFAVDFPMLPNLGR